MNQVAQNVTPSYQNNVCRTCAFTGEGNYFNFHDHFINFQKVFVPFLEVIRVVLDIDVCCLVFFFASTFSMIDLLF